MMWNFKNFGENVAAVDEHGSQLTYNKLLEEDERIKEAVGSRCLVFILCTNTLGALAGYTAFINGGIVPLLLSADLDQELLQSLVVTYKPDYLWVPEDYETEKLSAAVGIVKKVYGAYGYELIKTGYDHAYPLNDELCLLLTTSGSTGSPKLVRQSYKNVLSNAESIVQYLEIGETERAITTLPINYTYGLSIINSHLLAGARMLMTEKGLMQKDFWNFFKSAEATSFGGVPYTYEMLDKLRFQRMDLPSLRYMTQAGGKLQPELHKKFAEYARDKGIKFVVMYGQAEATARMGYLPAERSLEKYGSMGIAIPGGELSIIDVDGHEIKESHVTGELLYRGDNVTLGYAECGEDLQKGDERHGVLATGDMAQFDEDGYFYIVGRKKRFLKIFGNRVNLDEVDRLLKSKFEGLDLASSGVDDKLCVFVTEDGHTDEIRHYLSEKTGLNMSAFEVRYIAEIPRNDSGKVQYKLLQSML